MMDMSMGLIVGGWIGAFIGIVIMCIFQINKHD